MPTQSDTQTRLARDLRRNMTDAERALWELLRDPKATGSRFRRQHPIDRYVADFVCLNRKLVVELDGTVHDDPEARIRDAARTADLERMGYRVVRFPNEAVAADADAVVCAIREALADPDLATPTTELPSPARRERGGG